MYDVCHRLIDKHADDEAAYELLIDTRISFKDIFLDIGPYLKAVQIGLPYKPGREAVVKVMVIIRYLIRDIYYLTLKRWGLIRR